MNIKTIIIILFSLAWLGLSIIIILFSLAWLGLSIEQWVFYYPDTSSLIFAIGFFFIGLFVAYDHWWKSNQDEIVNDIQAIDKKCNDLEVKMIDWGNR